MGTNSIIDKSEPKLDAFYPEVLKLAWMDTKGQNLKLFLAQLLAEIAVQFDTGKYPPLSTALIPRVSRKIEHLFDLSYFITKLMLKYSEKNGRGTSSSYSNLAHLLGVIEAVKIRTCSLPASADVRDDLLGVLAQVQIEIYRY